jgi:hypothetical protein
VGQGHQARSIRILSSASTRLSLLGDALRQDFTSTRLETAAMSCESEALLAPALSYAKHSRFKKKKKKSSSQAASQPSRNKPTPTY